MSDYTCPLCRVRCRSWQARATHLRDQHGWCGGVVRVMREQSVSWLERKNYVRDAADRALRYEAIIAQDPGRP